jgi:transposase-like protein
MKSPCCSVDLVLRKKGKRFGELLLSCPECGGKWQCREGEYAHPYQVKRKADRPVKSISVRGRMLPSKYESLIREYGSFQKFLDSIQVM